VAAEYLARAIPVSSSSGLLALRAALMMRPVSESWTAMLTSRNTIRDAVTQLLEDCRAADASAGADVYASAKGRKVVLNTSLDRVHFYVQVGADLRGMMFVWWSRMIIVWWGTRVKGDA
jgi:type II secretory pathway component PulM